MASERDYMISERFSACLSVTTEESVIDGNASCDEGKVEEGNCLPRNGYSLDSEAVNTGSKKGNWRSMVGRKFGLTKKR